MGGGDLFCSGQHQPHYFVVFLNGNVYEKYDFMTNNMSSESGDA